MAEKTIIQIGVGQTKATNVAATTANHSRGASMEDVLSRRQGLQQWEGKSTMQSNRRNHFCYILLR